MDSDRFISAAAGIEYAHVGSLIHDDVIDGDALRRGRSSVAIKYGINTAVVAGDQLFFQLFATLARCRGELTSDERLLESIGVLAEAGIDLCRGEIVEEGLSGDIATTVESYLAMVELKTGALFRATCQAGAILAGAEDAKVERIAEYGKCLGIAFQIQDDILPYLADEAPGKSRLSDMKNKRVTLPVLYAYAHAGRGDRERLEWLFTASDLSPARAHEHVIPILTRTDALNLTQNLGKKYAQRARRQLDLLGSGQTERLLEYTVLAVNRSH